MTALSRCSGRTFWRLLLPLAGVLTLLPFVGPLTNPQRFLGTRDILRSFIPSKLFELQAWHDHGIIPLWNPLVGGGVPFRADLTNGPLYPLNALFPLFGEPRFFYAFSWYVAVHLPLAFLGFWVLLRSFGLRRSTALLLSFTYATSAYMVSAANSPNVLAAIAVLPLFFGCARIFLRTRRPVAGVVAAIALAWPVYAGAPDFALFAGLCAPFLCWRSWRKPPDYLRLAAVGGGALVLALPAALPFLEIIRHSTRNAFDLGLLLSDSFHPLRLFELFLPELWGNLFPTNTYVGRPLVNGNMDFPLIFSCYLAFSLPTLVIFSFLRRRPFRRNLPAVLASLALFVISFGARGYIYAFLAENFSPWRAFRFPEKWVALAILPLLLLSARGFQRLAAYARHGGAKTGPAIAMIAPLALALAGALLCRGRVTVSHSLLKFALLQSLLAGLFFLWCARYLSPRMFFILIFGVFAIDELSNSINYVWDQPLSLLGNPAAEDIQKDLRQREADIRAGGAYRIFSRGSYGEIGANFVPGNLDFIGRTVWLGAKNFVPNISMLYGLSDISIYPELGGRERELWWNNLSDKFSQRLFALLGAYYLVKPLPDIGFYRNPDALPFLLPVKEAEAMANFAQTLDRLRDPSWNPARTVLIEAKKLPAFARATFALAVARGTDSIRIQAQGTGERNALLLVNESFDSHWDCAPGCEIVGRANGWAMAVLVRQWSPAGVVLRYR